MDSKLIFDILIIAINIRNKLYKYTLITASIKILFVQLAKKKYISHR